MDSQNTIKLSTSGSKTKCKKTSLNKFKKIFQRKPKQFEKKVGIKGEKWGVAMR